MSLTMNVTTFGYAVRKFSKNLYEHSRNKRKIFHLFNKKTTQSAKLTFLYNFYNNFYKFTYEKDF